MMRCMCRYTFPGEAQALYTHDVPVSSSADFEDSTFALHRIELPAGADVRAHLRQGGQAAGEQGCLVFEAFECFNGTQDDELHAIGTLPTDLIFNSTTLHSKQVHFAIQYREIPNVLGCIHCV